MRDTVDHDDLAEQVANAPKEVAELTPNELREKFAEIIEYAEHELANACALVRGNHEMAALSSLRALLKSLGEYRRGVRV